MRPSRPNGRLIRWARWWPDVWSRPRTACSPAAGPSTPLPRQRSGTSSARTPSGFGTFWSASGLLPAALRKPFVQRLQALQDNLGEHQDTEVHSAYLTALSLELQGRPEVTAATLHAMGRLIELFERRRQAARDDFAER